MRPGFSCRLQTFSELLGDPGVLEVPHYQRPYSWTIREAQQLLDDLLLACADFKAAPDLHEGYFLGTILLIQQPASASSDPAAPRVLDIVDGQQRILTLAMLLALIRIAAHEKDSDLDDLVGPMLWMVHDADHALRIRPMGRDTYVLNALVAGRPPAPFHTDGEAMLPLHDVWSHLASAIADLDADELEALARYIADCCHFGVLMTSSVDRAHRIFSVVNSRGRPLARNDILKANLLGAVAPSQRPHLVTVWDGIAAKLGDKLETLLSHVRTIEGRAGSQILNELTQIVDRQGGAEHFIRGTFAPYASIYESLQASRMPTAGGETAVSRTLRHLNWLGSEDWVPSAMLFWRHSGGDGAHLARFLSRLDRLAYAMRLRGLGADKRATRLNRVLAAVRDGSDLYAPGSPLEVTREELRTIGYNLRNLHVRSQITCKLVLMRLNEAMHPGLPIVSPSDYTVEHILPQKPGQASTWRTWFPVAEEREACTHSLGNLVLVTRHENEKARNLELDRKLDIYCGNGGDSALAITRELAGQTTWLPQDVRAREARLIDLLRALWDLDVSTAPRTDEAPRGRARQRTGELVP